MNGRLSKIRLEHEYGVRYCRFMFLRVSVKGNLLARAITYRPFDKASEICLVYVLYAEKESKNIEFFIKVLHNLMMLALN